MAIASFPFPGPRATFGCTKEHGGPSTLPHVCDVKGRKMVQRPKVNVVLCHAHVKECTRPSSLFRTASEEQGGGLRLDWV